MAVVRPALRPQAGVKVVFHLLCDHMKDFDAIHDLPWERVARWDHDGLIVLPRAPRWQRFYIHRATAVGLFPIRTVMLGALRSSRRSIALLRLGRSGLCAACPRCEASNGGSG